MFLLLLHLQIKWRATINLLSVTEDGLHFVEYYLNRIIHLDVDSEAKKLLGLGQKHLVMGDIPAAVNAFQEAASLLGKKYGETANECGEAFFFYGKSLLELARMENGVLGNALEGVHVEEEEGEKTEDESLAENNDNIDEEAREELREQVYDAMGEKEEAKKTEDKSLAKPETNKEQDSEVKKGGREDMDISESAEEPQEKVDLTLDWLTETSEEAKGRTAPEGPNEAEVTSGKPEQEAPDAEEEKSVSGTDVQEECRGKETEGSEEDDKENDKTEEMPNDSVLENKSLQENEEEEIGNLELAWDMLDLAKIIFKRQETKEAQLYAAQAHLKLGEVSVESENYVQAVEEFQSCLNLQEQYLEAHDRLLAETHYQLGLAYGYNSQYDEAVAQFSKSIEVIEKRMAVLNEHVKEAEGLSAEYKKEIEELKELLPEIREKIEDAKESQHSGNVAELALKATLVESSTSGFTPSGGGSSVSMIAGRKPTDGASSSNCVTDISHLVRKKRKPEEESPRKDDAKKAKPEPEVNGGSGDAVPSGNEVSENMEEEAENRAESRAAVEATVEAGATVESTAC
ncbi:nuclear autoantigenic sperm protein isoform X4 [Macaca thibetana thibetana]|uniref:nuclear autoantigenic sperm protein isoform X4 n=1 Tax=Macaca thibetana thibetana TaxID=257877 RepID=UPI0021BC6FEC|nr:nuclear autoantigenic sperm protein isoform X4 [Macaca thibetana thibetana]